MNTRTCRPTIKILCLLSAAIFLFQGLEFAKSLTAKYVQMQFSFNNEAKEDERSSFSSLDESLEDSIISDERSSFSSLDESLEDSIISSFNETIKEPASSKDDKSFSSIDESLEVSVTSTINAKGRGASSSDDSYCAMLFFGLPRSFELLVLPSIVKNILIPNLQHSCDIFVHYYDIQKEEEGRASRGGKIDGSSVYKLKEQASQLYNESKREVTPPYVSIISDTDESFWRHQRENVEKYRHTKDTDGNYVYFPWKDNYLWPTSIDNIVKQWHSIQSVWGEMEKYQDQSQRKYTRVAMFRSDVVYVKPINIFETSNKEKDEENKVAVIPDFASFPVNDRMIYGPYDAVKQWATGRFSRLEEYISNAKPGHGMHSERFMKYAIIPGMEEKGFKIERSPHICFFRTRANNDVLLKDCDGNKRFGSISLRRKRKWVEEASGASCHGYPGKKAGRILESRAGCHSEETSTKDS